jgi:hypothetical protein
MKIQDRVVRAYKHAHNDTRFLARGVQLRHPVPFHFSTRRNLCVCVLCVRKIKHIYIYIYVYTYILVYIYVYGANLYCCLTIKLGIVLFISIVTLK